MAVAGLVMVSNTAPCDSSLFHTAVELSGSNARLQGWLGDSCPADLDAARASVAWDFVLVAGYALLIAAILRRWWPLYEARRLKAIERRILWLPAAAAALDWVENVLILSMLGVDGERFTLPMSRWPIAISTVSWLKWMLVAASLVAAVMAVMLAVARRREPPGVASGLPADVAEAGDPPPPVDELGVCCSGGGIRSAAFSLGALESLERGGVMARARWLSAVSGGAYAATAWSLVNATMSQGGAGADRPNSAADIVDWLQQPIKGTTTHRHRFLRNGPGGLGRPIVAITMYVLFNVVVLAALVFALAWPLGRVLSSWAVQPALRTRDDLPDELSVPVELWLPGVLLFGLAVAVLLVSCLPSYRLAGLWRAAVLLLIAALALELLLVVLPLAMVWVGGWLSGGPSEARAGVIGTSALLGAAAAVWRLARPAVEGQIRPRLPKLGACYSSSLPSSGVARSPRTPPPAADRSGRPTCGPRWSSAFSSSMPSSA